MFYTNCINAIVGAKLARHIAGKLQKFGPISSPGYSEEYESLQIPDHVNNPESEIGGHESEQRPNLGANNYGASSAGLERISEATISWISSGSSHTYGADSMEDPQGDQD